MRLHRRDTIRLFLSSAMQDLHLAAARIDDETKAKIEALGFSEDYFRNCRNCSATSYHATFRGSPDSINDGLWNDAVAILRRSSEFAGVFELETCLDERMSSGHKHLVADARFAPPSLAI